MVYNFAVKKNKRQLELEKITEYYQKENIFDPSKRSPNKFVNKLQYRMLQYYNLMYNSRKHSIAKCSK